MDQDQSRYMLCHQEGMEKSTPPYQTTFLKGELDLEMFMENHEGIMVEEDRNDT